MVRLSFDFHERAWGLEVDISYPISDCRGGQETQEMARPSLRIDFGSGGARGKVIASDDLETGAY